jgi:hypothetical protein
MDGAFKLIHHVLQFIITFFFHHTNSRVAGVWRNRHLETDYNFDSFSTKKYIQDFCARELLIHILHHLDLIKPIYSQLNIET